MLGPSPKSNIKVHKMIQNSNKILGINKKNSYLNSKSIAYFNQINIKNKKSSHNINNNNNNNQKNNLNNSLNNQNDLINQLILNTKNNNNNNQNKNHINNKQKNLSKKKIITSSCNQINITNININSINTNKEKNFHSALNSGGLLNSMNRLNSNLKKKNIYIINHKKVKNLTMGNTLKDNQNIMKNLNKNNNNNNKISPKKSNEKNIENNNFNNIILNSNLNNYLEKVNNKKKKKENNNKNNQSNSNYEISNNNSKNNSNRIKNIQINSNSNVINKKLKNKKNFLLKNIQSKNTISKINKNLNNNNNNNKAIEKNYITNYKSKENNSKKKLENNSNNEKNNNENNSNNNYKLNKLKNPPDYSKIFGILNKEIREITEIFKHTQSVDQQKKKINLNNFNVPLFFENNCKNNFSNDLNFEEEEKNSNFEKMIDISQLDNNNEIIKEFGSNNTNEIYNNEIKKCDSILFSSYNSEFYKNLLNSKDKNDKIEMNSISFDNGSNLNTKIVKLNIQQQQNNFDNEKMIYNNNNNENNKTQCQFENIDFNNNIEGIEINKNLDYNNINKEEEKNYGNILDEIDFEKTEKTVTLMDECNVIESNNNTNINNEENERKIPIMEIMQQINNNYKK